ncbi:MAG: dTDP-4-dehydrorhamnose 3,5-epimerase [Bacteroidetes bacterium CG23_combo_of_CG06-09_8_20_14_all_32_9]|nr:MAG: dTDP-4-dehydrorhamnose 3,5-epimerase [Bacteroidetes bacterium CG23_combo_of_CG06-09_8_20_14_all_32_9]
MKVIETPIPGLVIIKPDVFADQRGYFFESFNKKQFAEQGLNYKFIQDNESKSIYGVIRGLHYQLEPHPQAKLVRVMQGCVFDVAVDLRKGSPTFGKWYGVELSCDNKLQLLIPRGFAHGFSVLSETAIFIYKCDGLYNKESERGICYNDPLLAIDWKIDVGKSIISEKDKLQPDFQNAEKNFNF